MSKRRGSIPFERLRMTDVDAGRRQERVARRDDQPARRRRHPRAGRLRHDRARLPRFLAPRTASRRASPTRLAALDVDDVAALARAGAEIRGWVVDGAAAAGAGGARSRRLRRARPRTSPDASFAVRSSATAEDLPDASFAGQQETFLNINGLDNILHAVKEVFASLYNDRAIAYRVHQGFAHARRRAVGRRAADGAQRPGRRRRACSRSTPSRASTRWCSSPRRTAWARRSCRARSIRTSSTSTSPTSPRAGRRSCARRVGGKAIRMVFADAQTAGKSTVDRRRAATPTGMRFSITDAEVAGARRATRSPSSSTTAARWTSSGAATAATASSTSCRRGRRR